MCNMMLQSMGVAGKASLISAARQGVFFIPFLFILTYFCGLFGVQICQPVSDVCAFLLSLPVGLYYMNQFKKGNK